MIKQRLRRIESILNQGDRPTPPERELQNVQDVIDLLEEQVAAVRAAPWCSTIAKARVIGHLASVARKTMEVGFLAARIEMLEAVLKQREKTQR
jgi:hypothetical protein